MIHHCLSALVLLAFSARAFAGFEVDTRSLARRHLDQLPRCSDVHFCSLDDQIEEMQRDGRVLTREGLQGAFQKSREPLLFIPLDVSNPELVALAAATSLGLVAFRHDQEITDAVSANHSRSAQVVSDVGNFLGSTAAIPIAAGSYFLGVLIHDGKLKKAGLFVVGSVLATSLVTAAVKGLSGRVRPNQDRGPYHFGERHNYSFWSGHTSASFSIATVFAELYKDDQPIVPWVAYGLATLTAYARVHDKAHWASDVIAGGIAGHVLTRVFMNAFRKDYEKRGFAIYPLVDVVTGAFMFNVSYVGRQPDVPMACAKIENVYARVSACFEEAISGKP